MGQLDDGGWIYIGYGDGSYQCIVRCEKITWDEDDGGTIFVDSPADIHVGFTLETYKRAVKIQGIFFDSKVDFDHFMVNIKALQNSGVFNLRVKTASAPTWVKWDGIYMTMPVLYVNKKGHEKVFRGESDVWKIAQLMLRQAGNLIDS